MNQEFSEQLSFVNECGIEKVFEIFYEWKPTVCNVCHTLGHATVDCHKAVVKKEWRPKAAEVVTQNKVDEDLIVVGITQGQQMSRRSSSPGKEVKVGNSFATLSVDDEEIVIGDVVCERRIMDGGDPPDGHG